jgi:hypothetical protein
MVFLLLLSNPRVVRQFTGLMTEIYQGAQKSITRPHFTNQGRTRGPILELASADSVWVASSTSVVGDWSQPLRSS